MKERAFPGGRRKVRPGSFCIPAYERSDPAASAFLLARGPASDPKWDSLQEPGSATWTSLAPAVEMATWEPPTIIAVSIFCCVCLLHLLAFIYAICFRSQRRPSPASTQKSSEEKEVVTFHPSSRGTSVHSQVESKGNENRLKNAPCWSSF